MRATLVLCLLTVLACATLAAPAQGADRRARAALELHRSPLFVHPDLLWMVPSDERAEIERVLRGSSVPVRVVVLPVISDDESFGDPERVLFGIQDALGRSGVLVVVDERGSFEIESFAVPRDIEVPFELERVGFEAPLLIGERLTRLVDVVERAPRAPAQTPTPQFLPVSRTGADDSMDIWEVLLGGALFGALAYGAMRIVAAIIGRVRAVLRAR